MKAIISTTQAAFLLAMTLLSPPSMADSDYDTARQLQQSGDILPLETILQKVQAQHPGKVLEIELEQHHGQLKYEIELLDPQGKVWELEIDPRSGNLLRKKEDN